MGDPWKLRRKRTFKLNVPTVLLFLRSLFGYFAGVIFILYKLLYKEIMCEKGN